MRYLLAVILVLLLPLNAEAYVGPGLGLGTIGVVLGTVLSVFLALIAIIWYPFKRLLKKMRTGKPDAGARADSRVS
jgi:hypothetical protein